MISNGKELINFIDTLLKPHGYMKKKDTWYLFTKECVCFFSIVKSPYSGRYDHVMGCFLNEIRENKNAFPQYYKNDLGYSLSDFVGKETSRMIFDIEKAKFSDDEREKIITTLFNSYVIPFLEDVSSKQGIKDAVSKYVKLKYSMKLRLKAALGIAIED